MSNIKPLNTRYKYSVTIVRYNSCIIRKEYDYPVCDLVDIASSTVSVNRRIAALELALREIEFHVGCGEVEMFEKYEHQIYDLITSVFPYVTAAAYRQLYDRLSAVSKEVVRLINESAAYERQLRGEWYASR